MEVFLTAREGCGNMAASSPWNPLRLRSFLGHVVIGSVRLRQPILRDRGAADLRRWRSCQRPDRLQAQDAAAGAQNARAGARADAWWQPHMVLSPDRRAAETLEWLQPFIVRRWPGQTVRFHGRERSFGTPYCSITSERLHELVTAALGDAARTGADVRRIAADHVELADGTIIQASGVIDGRGRARRGSGSSSAGRNSSGWRSRH